MDVEISIAARIRTRRMESKKRLGRRIAGRESGATDVLTVTNGARRVAKRRSIEKAPPGLASMLPLTNGALVLTARTLEGLR